MNPLSGETARALLPQTAFSADIRELQDVDLVTPRIVERAMRLFARRARDARGNHLAATVLVRSFPQFHLEIGFRDRIRIGLVFTKMV